MSTVKRNKKKHSIHIANTKILLATPKPNKHETNKSKKDQKFDTLWYKS